MNIFHNKLWISLLQKNEFHHFSFETHSLGEVIAKFQAPGLDFEGQTFYIKAKKTGGWMQKLVNFLQSENLGDHPARINLYFSTRISLEKFFISFVESFKPMTAAGGIPVAPDGDILLIYRLGLWDLAKGKNDPGETFMDAALREVKEETGIKTHVLGKSLQKTYHIFQGRKNGKWRFKTTWWWVMPCKKKESLTPQIEEGITKVKWFNQSSLRKTMPDTYPLIKEVLREYLYEKGK